jgi:arginyl-tRNA synthetase
MLLDMLKQRLARYLAGRLGGEVPAGIAVEEPRNKKFGDLSTNAAMVLAPVMKKNPLEIAGMIKDEEIIKWEEIEDVNIIRPGFINLDLKKSFLASSLKEIARKKQDYGKNDSGTGIKVQLEYVSSNPTGDLHIGHGRWGALGDSLANIYTASGYQVSREYYVNDFGTQAAAFARCAGALYLDKNGIEADYPGDGYPREVVSIAVEKLIAGYGKSFTGGDSGISDPDAFKKAVIAIMVEYIEETLDMMGAGFDSWFYESSLYDGNNFEKTIKDLKDRDLAYEDENALWFRSSKYGDEKDRVVIRSGGEPTYFASDIMYLESKADRGFDRMIYILGADHHGYVERLKAVGKALGLEEDRLHIIIGQLVNIVKDGKTVKMSRRKGKLYTLRDLIEEVGSDAVRYFFTSVSCDTPLDFDIELAKQQSNKNPVYYIQYAHARIESIYKKIEKDCPGDPCAAGLSLDKIDIEDIRLDSESEKQLAMTLLLFPDTVYGSCVNDAPHIISQYLTRLAAEFHHFYNKHRIILESKGQASVDRSRLCLVMLVQVVLQNALNLLNISAPEKM